MKTQVAIVGGGPGGTSTAMFLKMKGIDSVIIEKEEFPRYHIGESMTGECGAVVRALGLTEKMNDPNNAVVKRGLTVYGAEAKNKWYVGVMGRDKDWNLFPQTTWQVRRSSFDQMMLDSAVERGVDLVQGQATKPLLNDDGSVRGLEVFTHDGKRMEIESDMVVDASGQSTFLANAGVTSRKFRGNYDKQIAMFSQVEGAVRDPGPAQGDTLIFYREKYHWSWFIPIDEQTTSVAVIAPAAYYLNKKESKPDYLTRELNELNPEIKRRIPDLRFVEDVRAIPNYSYQIKNFTGKGFMCIGDSHRFIDPIFSFGLYVAMKEAQFGSQAIAEYLNGKNHDAANPFADYQRYVEDGIDVFEDVIDLFWEYPIVFALFIHQRYPDLMIDSLAGRVFDEHQPNAAVKVARDLLNRARQYDVNAAPEGVRFVAEDPLRYRRNYDAFTPGMEVIAKEMAGQN